MADTSAALVDLEIGAVCNGWPVVVRGQARFEQLPRLLERLESVGLRPAGGGIHPATKPRQPRQEPLYQPDGTPCCPRHQKPLKQGQYGLYCSAKDAEGKNSYCDLRFQE